MGTPASILCSALDAPEAASVERAVLELKQVGEYRICKYYTYGIQMSCMLPLFWLTHVLAIIIYL